MIVFSEFECPFCAAFAEHTWPSLLHEYVDSGLLLVAYRHFPLQIHRNALAAAKAAECAARTGRFWEMHDVLFEAPRPLDPSRFASFADRIGLDGLAFRQCIAGDVESKIMADMAAGRAMGVSGTPTFFFGRQTPDGAMAVVSRLTGARPFTDFKARIDALLSGEP
jgi:protein-disulfide isomerase